MEKRRRYDKHFPRTAVVVSLFSLFSLLLRVAALDPLRKYLHHHYNTWRTRGWLIMMRAHHHRRISAKCKASPAMLRELRITNKTNIIKDDTTREDIVIGHKNTSPFEVELLEAGRHNMKFMQAAMVAACIDEDWLFRHIITYL